MLDFRLRVFEPWAAHGRVLPGFVSLSWGGKLNDHSVLSVQVEAGSESERLLDGEVEVALEISAGDATWVEPPGCRFKSQSSKVDLVKAASTRDYQFIGLSAVLNQALVWDATPGDEHGKRVFLAQSPGSMLGAVLDGAKRRRSGGRDWAPGLAWAFTAERDSAGQGWGKNAANEFVPTAPLMKVLDWLTSKGAVDWRMRGRELQVFRAGGTMAANVDAPLRSVFASAVPVTVTVENLATTALMRGKNGKQWTRDSGSAVSAFGRIEVGVDQGQVELDATAQLHMESRLAGGASPKRQYRREWVLPTPGAPVLWLDYEIGQWVDVAGERMRVVEAGVKVNEKGEVSGWETLGSRIDSLVERLARRTTDLSDGMVGGENSPVSVAVGPDQETGVPVAPAGLLVASDPVGNADGSHASVVRMVWEPVKSTVDGKRVTVDQYHVQVVENGGKAFDFQAFEPAFSASGAPGNRWRIRVRALSRQNVWGEWSTVVDHVLRADQEPPPKPAKPVLSDDLGVLKVSHNGLDSSGAAMPADVDFWQVAVSTSNTSNPDPDGVVADAGGLVWHRAGLDAGTRYYVRVRAVDRSGNVGAWSDSVSGTVSLVFDPEPLKREIANGTIIGDDAIKTRHLAALSVGADQLKANSIRAAHMQVGALDGYVLTGATVQTSRAANSGVKMNNNGIYAYDSTGHETVRITGNGGEISGFHIRGSILESNSTSGKVRISDGRIIFSTSGGVPQLVLDDNGLFIMEGTTNVGHINGTHKAYRPDIKGLSMLLSNEADFVLWGYQETKGSNPTAMLTLDPKGKFYPGKIGIHLGQDLWMNGCYFRSAGGRKLILGDWGNSDGVSLVHSGNVGVYISSSDVVLSYSGGSVRASDLGQAASAMKKAQDAWDYADDVRRQANDLQRQINALKG